MRQILYFESSVEKTTYKQCNQHLNQVSYRLFCKALVNRSKAQEAKIFFVIKITVWCVVISNSKRNLKLIVILIGNNAKYNRRKIVNAYQLLPPMNLENRNNVITVLPEDRHEFITTGTKHKFCIRLFWYVNKFCR